MLQQAASESTTIVVPGVALLVSPLGIVVHRGVLATAMREIHAMSDRLRIIALRLALGAKPGEGLLLQPVKALGDCPRLGL
eukprot:139169-Pyramimonas_sp.AAC.1